MASALTTSLPSLILSLGIASKTILATLAACSVMSWAIILYKISVFQKAASENRRFLAHFEKTPRLHAVKSAVINPNQGPLWSLSKNVVETLDPHVDWDQGVLHASHGHPLLSSVERMLRNDIHETMDYYEGAVHILATVGNTAPFIGLLGTVWGIMNAFHEIGLMESANIAVVAPGVAEALVATAAGLTAAIPAVIAYNFFVHHLRTLEGQLGIFASELMALIEEAYHSTVAQQNEK